MNLLNKVRPEVLFQIVLVVTLTRVRAFRGTHLRAAVGFFVSKTSVF